MYAEQSTEKFQSHVPKGTSIIFTKPDALYKATSELLKFAGDKMMDVKSHLRWPDVIRENCKYQHRLVHQPLV